MSRKSSRAYKLESPEAHFRTSAPRAVSAQEHRRTDDRRPPIHHHLQESQPIFPPANPTPAPPPTLSALSFVSTATSQLSDVTAVRPPTLGVTSPNYRDTLSRHQIYIDSMGRRIPKDVQNWSSEILGKQRTSPGLSEDQIENTQDVLAQLESESDTATRETLAALPLFPPKFSQPYISEGHGELCRTRAVSHTRGQGIPPVSTPKADRSYGYKSTTFDDREYAAVNHRALRPYAQPGSTSYWPFFMVEFKAQSRGGTFWGAVNQNAGTGAHSLRSIETLRNYSKTLNQKQFDNFIFTCVADTTNAALWVHWLDGSRYNMAEVAHFHFAKSMELRAFRDSVKNIIDYAVDVRLPRIKELLREIAVHDLERIEKAKRTRRSSEADNLDSIRP